MGGFAGLSVGVLTGRPLLARPYQGRHALVLVNALVNLSRLIDAIVDMGFGSLLSLSIVDFPSQLMYWLVANFNPASSELLLDSMRRIRIEPNDVRVLGFPNGQQPIVKKTKSETCDLYTGWPAMFGREDYKVTPKQVADKMLSFVDGGDWFRRLFLILVEYLIIGNFSTAYVYPHLLKSLVDVRNARNLAWCEHTLTTLVEKRVACRLRKITLEFNGPSLFLAVLFPTIFLFFDFLEYVLFDVIYVIARVFYVDRVKCVRRSVPRAVPIVSAWSGDKLKERNNKEIDLGGFGMGLIEPRLMGSTNEPQLEFGLEGEGCFRSGDLVIPADERLKCLSSDVVEIISILQSAPKDLVEDAEFAMVGNALRGFYAQPHSGWGSPFERWYGRDGKVTRMKPFGARRRIFFTALRQSKDVETEVGGVKPSGFGEVEGRSDIALERSKKVFSRRATRKTKQSADLVFAICD
ncbi:hypothetical protein DH2020_016399 [Rehmannia glutinosa]|uniref:Uncharacterized protein n=1 Tax=Rehmannia glutinosa TaxID=99300 RepID=A0ABR0WRA2_REHGL